MATKPKLIKRDTGLQQGELFDYSAFDQETQIMLRMRASEITTLGKRMTQDAVEIGGKLAEVKDRIGNNERFVDWLERELKWSERSAYNFIAVYQKFHGEDLALPNIAASALYLLAAPSTPPEAVEAAKEMARSGEKVTHTVAKEIVGQAKTARKQQQPRLVPEPQEELEAEAQTCRKCGCTDDDCSQCIEKTGVPCTWVEPDLCSACALQAKPKEAKFNSKTFPTEFPWAELERMSKLRWIFDGQDQSPAQICYVEGNGRHWPFLITEYEKYDSVFKVTAQPLVSLDEYGPEKAISYTAFLDSEKDISDLAGVKLNFGSSAKPSWWVATGPEMKFTAKPAPPAQTSTLKSQPTTESLKADAALDRRWKELKITLTISLMPVPLNRDEPRVIIGSVTADRCAPLIFNVREDDFDQVGQLAADKIRQFRSELLSREQKTTAKPAPPKTSARPAPKSSGKPAGKGKQTAGKPVKKGGKR